MYPVPVIRTSRDFLPRKPALRKSLLAKTESSLPGLLSTPPIPDFNQGEVLLGQLMKTAEK